MCPEGPDGDFELARPEAAGAVAVEHHEGDYELDRPRSPEPSAAAPGTAPAPPGPPTAPARIPADPDAPVGVRASATTGPTAEPAAPAPVHSAAPGDATTEPDAPAPAHNAAASVHEGPVAGPSQPAPTPTAPPAGPPADPSVSAPVQGGAAMESGAPSGLVHTAPVAAPPAEVGAPVVASGPPGAGAEQPKPLHDPDPYSTPPYGEPGPWAPAPPVQHPAATPAHGMTVPAPPVTPEPVAPHAVPAAPPAPAPVPAAAPTQDAPAAADPWGRYDPWAAAANAPLQQADPVAEDEKLRRRRARRTVIGAALLLALVSGGIGGTVGVYLERNGGVGSVELPQADKEAAGRDPDSVAGIAAQALPSVVTLHVSGAGEAGTGTGFVLDERGHILTNNHVVEPAGDDGEITVTFNSGDTAEATVVGRDSGYDLAVVKVKGVSGLSPLPLGNSDNVRVGDPVVAIGAPFDLAGTVTSGIISAKERPITAGGEKGDGSDVSYVDALQTDAPINPGNSGGPLLDAEARVIGINSAIRSAGGGADLDGGQAGSIGLGFAIPINQGKRVAEELINTGRAAHPVIGITLDMDHGGDGARVADKGGDGGPAVVTGGPGARAGIRSGDVITEVDGRRVHSGEELIVKIRAHRPGDRLELTLERDGTERKVSLVLGSSDGG